MKKTILIFLITSSIYSQKIKGFGAIGAYLSVPNFKHSSFSNVSLGLEYNLNPWLRPEIEASFFFGNLYDSETVDFATGFITDKYYRSFSSENFSLNPKFTIDISNDLERISLFQIMPKFNFTRVQAEEQHYVLNSKKTNLDFYDSDKIIEFRQSIGIGIGVYFEISDRKSDAIALNLYYNNIDFGNSLSNLKNSKTDYHTNQVLGVGINYYFGFIKKKNK